MNTVEFVKQKGGVFEYRLKSNGLKILLLPKESNVSVVTFNIVFHVGSRNEGPGTTGYTHGLEHLAFKGSMKYNKPLNTSIWNVLQKTGANINATTSKDRTHFFATLPSQFLSVVADIESDRMRNNIFTQKDVEGERVVVRNEFERGNGNPIDLLSRDLWSVAYTAHPYGIPTIGYRSDLESMTAGKLRKFYDEFYWPNNATVIVVGSFDKDSALEIISDKFSKIPKSPVEIPSVTTVEPTQHGPKTFSIKRAVGRQTIVTIAYKTPPAMNKDAITLQLIDRILSDGKSSRLYKKLVESGMASSVSTSTSLLRDNGLSRTFIMLNNETQPADVIGVFLEEIDGLMNSTVTSRELERAKNKIRIQHSLEQDSSSDVMFGLNESTAAGSWELYVDSVEETQKVTAKNIQDVSKKYFVEKTRTIGTFIPSRSEDKVTDPFSLKTKSDSDSKKQFQEEESREAKTDNGQMSFLKKDGDSAQFSKIEPLIEDKFLLGGNLRLLTMKTNEKGIVAIYGSLPGGSFHDQSNRFIPILTAFMLDEGTKTRSKFEIAELMEDNGIEIDFSVHDYRINFKSKFLAEQIPLVMELISDQLKNPRFEETSLQSVKKRARTSLDSQKNGVNVQADIMLSQTIYPEGHPNRQLSTDEEILLLESVTVEDIKRFHQENYGLGKYFNVVVTGDFVASKVEEELMKNFQGWQSSSLTVPPELGFSKAQKLDKVKLVKVSLEDKSSTTLLIGQPTGIDEKHKDYIALSMGVYVLGMDFSSRLMQIIRDTLSLTYGIRSDLTGFGNDKDGIFRIRGTFAPSLLEKGQLETLKQMQLWYEKGITEQELNDKKSTVVGRYYLGMETVGGLAGKILDVVEQQRPLSWLDEYPRKIQSLTKEEINQVIRKHLSLNSTVIVKSGTF